MIIKNYNELATNKERKTVMSFVEAGILSVLPDNALKNFVSIEGDILSTQNKKYNLKKKRIFVVGAGKASASMAKVFEEIIGAERIVEGIVLSNDTSVETKKIEIIKADHPIPSEKNLKGTERILALKGKYDIGENDLIVGLISGGGSAMLISPAKGITLSDKQKMTELLISSGASGYENTTVKRWLSKVKGGGLAEHFSPASILSLIISDDNGKATHEMTASGPFSESFVTRDDVLKIFENFKLMDVAPPSILSFLKVQNEKIPLSEKRKEVSQYIVAQNKDALLSIKEKAENEGIDVVMELEVHGEARDVAYKICENIYKNTITKPTLFLYGGETTVTLNQPQKNGGRNQEFTASCLNYFYEKPFKGKWCIASAGTDGIDFIADSAGGIIDNESLRLLKDRGLDGSIPSFLDGHRTGSLLSQINSNIYIGHPTGTNVGDVMLFYIIPYESKK